VTLPTPALRRFVETLVWWRKTSNKYSQRELARLIDCDSTWVNAIERYRELPSAGFAEGADRALNAGGAILNKWREWDLEGRQFDLRPPPTPVDEMAMNSVLTLLHDDFQLLHYGTSVHCTVTLDLQNRTDHDVWRIPVSTGVPVASAHYGIRDTRDVAVYSDVGAQPRIEQNSDGTTFIELGGSLRAGHSARFSISYEMAVPVDFGTVTRYVSLPTKAMTVQLILPITFRKSVSGGLTSLTERGMDLPINRREHKHSCEFRWGVQNPELHSKFIFSWGYPDKGLGLTGGEYPDATLSEEAMAELVLIEELTRQITGPGATELS